ncbi:MAG: sigma-70 family RNA polymerase sigma factor [Actinobacteria bacterium]|nr:sigma-70 family RNA polymerase sigma factor [Actinomycetota bacterium]
MEGRPLEEAELARRAREGDDVAYEELVKRYGQIAFRVAWLVTRDRAEAEDSAQEAFVKAYYALPRFRPDSPFRPWLLKIVANEARNRARSTRRRQGLALRTAAVSDVDAVPSPETAALAQEDREMLVAALNRLPPPDREVIGYRFLLGLSESETADVLDVRLGTAKSRLSRAMARLRAVIEEPA